MTQPEDELITLSAAAKLAQVNPKTIYRQRRTLRAIKIGHLWVMARRHLALFIKRPVGRPRKT